MFLLMKTFVLMFSFSLTVRVPKIMNFGEIFFGQKTTLINVVVLFTFNFFKWILCSIGWTIEIDCWVRTNVLATWNLCLGFLCFNECFQMSRRKMLSLNMIRMYLEIKDLIQIWWVKNKFCYLTKSCWYISYIITKAFCSMIKIYVVLYIYMMS